MGPIQPNILHMDKRGVKVGQFVKQGDYIGTVGMTGNTPQGLTSVIDFGKMVDRLIP